MKRINATFEVENDLQEHNLRNILEGINAKYVNTLPNTDHLKDNETFIKLVKGKRNAQLLLDRFTNENRCSNISIKDVENLEVDGVDIKDYPDFCDAFFADGWLISENRNLTDDELMKLGDDYPEVLSEMAYERYL